VGKTILFFYGSLGEQLESGRIFSYSDIGTFISQRIARFFAEGTVMDEIQLTPEQEQRAEVLFQRIEELYREEARRVARLFVSKPDSQVLGKTEFQLRDIVQRLATSTVEAALEERKKGGTRGRA
jgi:hypothetical protein